MSSRYRFDVGYSVPDINYVYRLWSVDLVSVTRSCWFGDVWVLGLAVVGGGIWIEWLWIFGEGCCWIIIGWGWDLVGLGMMRGWIISLVVSVRLGCILIVYLFIIHCIVHLQKI